MSLHNKRSLAAGTEDLLASKNQTPDHLSFKLATRPLILDRIIPPPLKNHPFIFWALIGIILGCASIAISLQTSNPKAYAQLCVLQIIGLVAVPSVIRVCHSLLLDWSINAKKFITGTRRHITNIDTWLDQELSIFEGSPIMLLAGAALATLAPIGFSFANYPIGIGSVENIFALSIVATSAFAAGVALCAMAYGTRIIWRFGNTFRVSVQSHKFGVLSTGEMLLHCCVLIALTWSAYSSSAIFGVTGTGVAIFSVKNPIWILAAPSAAVVLISFIVCQIPLHQRMIEYKHDQLLTIEKILEELKESDARLLNAEVMSKIEFFENRRLQIISLPEWPFAFGTLLGSFGSASMMILTTVVSSYVKTAWALP